MKLDFKRFKKIASTPASTTLKHADGHQITIAHARLTPKTMSELKALPMSDGGSVPPKGSSGSPSEPDPKKAAAVQKGAGGPTDKKGWENVKEQFGFADGGEVPKEAAYNPEDYIPVPRALLQQHMQHLQQQDVPLQGPTATLADLMKSKTNEDTQRMRNNQAIALDRMNMDMNPNAVGPRQPGAFDKPNEVEMEGMQPALDLATVGATGGAAKPFHISQGEAKAAQIAAGAFPRTAAAANNLDKGVQSAADVIMNNAGKLKNKGMAQGGQVRQSNPKLEESKKQPPRANYADGDAIDVSDVGQLPPAAEFPQAPAAGEPASQDPGPSIQDTTANSAPFQAPYNPTDATDTENSSIGKEINPKEAAAGMVSEAKPAPQQEAPPVNPNSPSFQKGYEQTMGGIKATATAMQALGDKQAADRQEQVKNNQIILDTHQKNIANLEKERQAYMKDIKDGFIDPNKYWENHSRVAASIGMLLAGLSGSPTAGVDILNNEINRSIEAQKANLGAKHNLLSATLAQFGNVRDAENMTRALMQDSLSNQLGLAAAQSTGPLAKANAQQLMGQLTMDAGMKMQQIGAAQTVRQLADSGNENLFVAGMNKAQAFAPDAYKDLQSKYLPGIGVARVPVPAGDRETIQGFTEFGKDLDRAIAFQDRMGKTGAWTPANKAEALRLNRSLAVEMPAKLAGLKRLNPEEYHNAEAQLGNIGGINMGGTSVKLQGIKQQLKDHVDSMAGSLGVRPFANANAAPSAPVIKNFNGVPYAKVPGGWQKVK